MVNSAGQAFRDPCFLAKATVLYTADEFRNILDAVTSAGRRDNASLLVTQHAAGANLQVDVSPGVAVVPGTTSGIAVNGVYPQGLYVVRLDATCAVGPVAAATNRSINVYVQVADSTVLGSGLDEAIIKIQDPAGTLPASSLLLATVVLQTGKTIVNAADTVPTTLGIHPSLVFSAPASQAGAISTATARSSQKQWLWGLPGTGWLIPGAGWNLPVSSSRTVDMIGGHLYEIVSQFAVYGRSATGADVRAAIQVDNVLSGFGQGQVRVDTSYDVIFPSTLVHKYYAATSGNHVVGTYFSCVSGVNHAALWAANCDASSMVTDLGPMVLTDMT